jgi:DNA primase
MHNDDAARVKEATDLVELVGSYVELRRSGSGYAAICPWHSDRRPSLQVNPARQIWRCWVCDIGGDCYGWVMQFEGADFKFALKSLADRAGISLTDDKGSKRPPGDRATAWRVLEWAAKKYRDALKGSDGYQYLRSRGISDESIDRFGLGFAPSDWVFLLSSCLIEAKATPADLEMAGLAGKSEKGRYDRFRGRVIFPIRDLQGRIISLGGRALPGGVGAKYINGPETPVFSKSRNLYALDLARESIRKTKQSIVMEGYTDVIIAHQYGVTNAVACLGTAFGEHHARILKHHGESIVLALDGDTAGLTRAEAVLPVLVGVDAKIAVLPEGNDPADFIAAKGGAAFNDLVKRSPDPLEFKVKRAFDGVGDDNAKSRAAVESVAELVANASPIVRAQASVELSHATGLSRSVIDQVIAGRRKAESVVKPRAAAVPVAERLPKGEAFILALIAGKPELVTPMLEQVRGEWCSEAFTRVLELYQSREMDGEDLSADAMLLAGDEHCKAMIVRAIAEAEQLIAEVFTVQVLNKTISGIRSKYERAIEVAAFDAAYYAACQNQPKET